MWYHDYALAKERILMKDNRMIDSWLNSTPADAPADEVERVLVAFFGRDSVKKASGSHQYRIKHPALADLPGFGIGGYLSIPISGGKRVKGYYLKRIAQAIQHLEEIGLE